jgi:hypothetical protein
VVGEAVACDRLAAVLALEILDTPLEPLGHLELRMGMGDLASDPSWGQATAIASRHTRG